MPAGGGNPNATKPNIYPNDGTYGWAYAGADDTARSGLLSDASGNPLFTAHLTASPAPVIWPIYDAGSGPNGIAAARADYPTLSFPGGGPDFYLYGAVVPALSGSGGLFPRVCYYRYFIKQSNPWNGNNQDVQKLLRLKDPVGLSLMEASSGGPIVMDWDSWDGGCPIPTGTWDFNAHLGQWNCYELCCDISLSDRATTTIWVNDVQVFQNTVINGVTPACPSGTRAVNTAGAQNGTVQWTGVVNSISQPGSCWFTMLGISSQRMYAPPGFTFPA